jgi:pimeloyl-ACP methyl ester carboxylesterase
VATHEREFRTKTASGDLVGWVRDSPRSKANALLLHGGPGLSEYLAPLADELDDLLTTARYQQRGLAPSTIDGDASVEGQVADAMAVIRALGWQRPIVIGHSWGGYLAMHIGAAHPDAAGAFVIIDSLGAVDRGGQREFGPNLRRNLSAEQLARLDELDHLDEPTQDDMREHLGILWPNYFGDPASATPMPHYEFAANNGETWASIQAHFRKGTLARRLPLVTTPTLVIHGERSPIPLVQAEHIVELMPSATLAVVPGGGHLPWLERPGFVRNRVEAFLASS